MVDDYPLPANSGPVLLEPLRASVGGLLSDVLARRPRRVPLATLQTNAAEVSDAEALVVDMGAGEGLPTQEEVFFREGKILPRHVPIIFIVDETDLDRTAQLFDVENSTIVAWPCSEEDMETTLEVAGLQSRLKEQSAGYGEADLHSLRAEVERVAHALDRLVGENSEPLPVRQADERTPAESAAMLREIIRRRRLRSDFFPAEFFADPAWDILLDLAAARHEDKPVSISSLCIAASVPTTTGLRWIKALTDAGLLERTADPTDGRRSFITLADRTAALMERYLDVAS